MLDLTKVTPEEFYNFIFLFQTLKLVTLGKTNFDFKTKLRNISALKNCVIANFCKLFYSLDCVALIMPILVQS